MPNDKRAASDPEFFPDNVEFLGFIGGWDCDVGIDTIPTLFYLIRTGDLDWLEEVVKYSSQVISKKCVSSIPREGSKREAAARLLDARVRSRVHYECPVPPYRPGLLTRGEIEEIVKTIANELKRNSEVAEEKQRRHPASIITMARELGLGPRPAGHNDSAWMASCPGTGHWLMISPAHDEFGCGYCGKKGRSEDLRSLYEARCGERKAS